MNRRSVVVLILAAFVLAGARAGALQTPNVDDLIAKNVQAKGGLEKIRAVQTIKQTGKLSLGGMEVTLVVYAKRPNMSRQELTVTAMGQQVISAFDGQTAWSINPLAGVTTPTVVTGPEADALKEQSDFEKELAGPLAGYKAAGATLEFVGTEPSGDRKFHHLKMTSKDQKVMHCYLDAETNLEARIVGEAASPLGKVETEQLFSDYRDVEGLKMPFLVRSLVGGSERAKITVEKVEVNAKFDEGIFKLPKGQ